MHFMAVKMSRSCGFVVYSYLNMVSLHQFKGMQSVCERATICQYNAYERGKFSGKNGT